MKLLMASCVGVLTILDMTYRLGVSGLWSLVSGLINHGQTIRS